MTACLSDWRTAQWLVSVPHPYEHQESLDWIREVVPRGWADGSEFWLAVADEVTDEFLGEVGLRLPEPRTRCGEIGYWLTPAARGRGAMRRALTLMIDWVFTDLGLERIDWSASVGNDHSWSVAEAVGFSREGLRRRRAFRVSDGTRHDEWVAGLLRSDWRPGG
ncbi:MAG: GNAT family N-acetyltransferase [Frankiales bacterium]|nr:GNAT family N-acetyltransferase [Frankiales bacterium]